MSSSKSNDSKFSSSSDGDRSSADIIHLILSECGCNDNGLVTVSKVLSVLSSKTELGSKHIDDINFILDPNNTDPEVDSTTLRLAIEKWSEKLDGASADKTSEDEPEPIRQSTPTRESLGRNINRDFEEAISNLSDITNNQSLTTGVNINALQEQVNELEHKNTKLAKTNSDMQKQMLASEEMINQLHCQIDEITEKSQVQQKKIDQLRKRCEQLEEVNQENLNRIEKEKKIEEKLTVTNKQVLQLQHALQQLENEVQKKQDLIDKLQIINENQDQQLAYTHKEKENKELIIAQLKSDFNELNEIYESKEEIIKNLKDENENLLDQKVNLERDVNALKERNLALVKQVKENTGFEHDPFLHTEHLSRPGSACSDENSIYILSEHNLTDLNQNSLSAELRESNYQEDDFYNVLEKKLHQIEDELQESYKRSTQLELACEKLATEADELRKVILEKEEKVKQLEIERTNLESSSKVEKLELEKRIENQASEISMLRDTCDVHNSEMKKLAEDYKKKLCNSQSQVAVCDQEKDALEKRIQDQNAEHLKEKNKLLKELDIATTKCDKFVIEISSLKRKEVETKTNLIENESKLKSLHEKLSEMESSLESARNKEKMDEQKIKELTKKLEKLSDYEEIKINNEVSQTKLKQKELEIKIEHEKLQETKMLLEKAQNEKNILETKLNEITEELSKLKNEFDACTRDCDKLKSQLLDLNLSNENLQAKLKVYESDERPTFKTPIKKGTRLELLHYKMEKIDNQLCEEREKCKTLSASLEKITAERNSLREELDHLKKEKKELSAQRDNSKTKLTKQAHNIEALEMKMRQMRQTTSELKEKFVSSDEEIDLLKKKIEELEEKLSEADLRNAKVKETVNASASILKTHRHSLREQTLQTTRAFKTILRLHYPDSEILDFEKEINKIEDTSDRLLEKEVTQLHDQITFTLVLLQSLEQLKRDFFENSTTRQFILSQINGSGEQSSAALRNESVSALDFFVSTLNNLQAARLSSQMSPDSPATEMAEATAQFGALKVSASSEAEFNNNITSNDMHQTNTTQVKEIDSNTARQEASNSVQPKIFVTTRSESGSSSDSGSTESLGLELVARPGIASIASGRTADLPKVDSQESVQEGLARQFRSLSEGAVVTHQLTPSGDVVAFPNLGDTVLSQMGLQTEADMRLPRPMSMSAWFPGWNRFVGFTTANVLSHFVRDFIRAAPCDEHNPMLCSLHGAALMKSLIKVNEKLALMKPTTRFQPGNSERLTEEEVEAKFQMLTLAFAIDAVTLADRRERQRRQRDQAEDNFDMEVTRLVQCIRRLNPLCVDAETTELVTSLLNQLDIIVQASSRISTSAEVFGSVQQEWRLAESVNLMLAHLRNLRQQRDTARRQLQNTKRMLQESTSAPEVAVTRQRSLATSTGRRRASIATLPRQPDSPRPLSSPSCSTETLMRRMTTRRPSASSGLSGDCSRAWDSETRPEWPTLQRSPTLCRPGRPSRLDLGRDLTKITEGSCESSANNYNDTPDSDFDVCEGEGATALLAPTTSQQLISLQSPTTLREHIDYYSQRFQTWVESGWNQLVETGTLHEFCVVGAIVCFVLATFKVVNIFLELEYSRRGLRIQRIPWYWMTWDEILELFVDYRNGNTPT